jgi:hypothetical protein
MTDVSPIPDGMTEVTCDEFHAWLSSDKRDIMPSVSRPDVTLWQTREQSVVGVSYPGWRNPSAPKKHALLNSYARMAKALPRPMSSLPLTDALIAKVNKTQETR